MTEWRSLRVGGEVEARPPREIEHVFAKVAHRRESAERHAEAVESEARYLLMLDSLGDWAESLPLNRRQRRLVASARGLLQRVHRDHSMSSAGPDRLAVSSHMAAGMVKRQMPD